MGTARSGVLGREALTQLPSPNGWAVCVCNRPLQQAARLGQGGESTAPPLRQPKARTHLSSQQLAEQLAGGSAALGLGREPCCGWARCPRHRQFLNSHLLSSLCISITGAVCRLWQRSAFPISLLLRRASPGSFPKGSFAPCIPVAEAAESSQLFQNGWRKNDRQVGFGLGRSRDTRAVL